MKCYLAEFGYSPGDMEKIVIFSESKDGAKELLLRHVREYYDEEDSDKVCFVEGEPLDFGKTNYKRKEVRISEVEISSKVVYGGMFCC